MQLGHAALASVCQYYIMYVAIKHIFKNLLQSPRFKVTQLEMELTAKALISLLATADKNLLVTLVMSAGKNLSARNQKPTFVYPLFQMLLNISSGETHICAVLELKARQG